MCYVYTRLFVHMEKAQVKYNNFKQFISAEVPNLGWMQYTQLNSTSLLFLSTIYDAYDPEMSLDEITNKVKCPRLLLAV